MILITKKQPFSQVSVFLHILFVAAELVFPTPQPQKNVFIRFPSPAHSDTLPESDSPLCLVQAG